MHPIFSKDLSPRLESLLDLAKKIAVRFNQDSIESECLLLSLIELGKGQGLSVLRDHYRINISELQAKIKGVLTTSQHPVADPPFCSRAGEVLHLAIKEADGAIISTDHILLGIIRGDRSIAGQTLRGYGITLENARERVLE